MWTYNHTNELYHHGTKHMKWGVRRYQNYDGTLTELGKKRYARDIADNKARKKDNRIEIDGPDANRWVREDITRTKRLTDETSKMVDLAKDIERDTRQTPKKEKLDLSKMTDQQLREQINRANLEKQYNDLFSKSSTQVSKGREVTMSILETAGTVLAVGSSALGIALAIKELGA